MKVSLRDLFWLILLVASLTLWGVEQYRWAKYGWHLVNVRLDDYRSPTDYQLRRWAAITQIAQMSDEDLSEYLTTLPLSSHFRRATRHLERCIEREPCLIEMARRRLTGGLQRYYDDVMVQSAGNGIFDLPENLEPLTALRRAQGCADPLRIRVELAGQKNLASNFYEPQLRAVIENVDSGKETVMLQEGGDYRGGRLDRWRFLLMDEKGRPVGDSNYLSGMGGGISQTRLLYHGDVSTGNYVFDLRKYLAPPRSGKYQLQAIYHNSIPIAGEQEVSGLIVVKSAPIPVIVNNPQNRVTKRPWINIPAPLAVLFACLGLTLTSITSSDVQSCNRIRRLSFSPGISRRDFRWGILIIVIASGMWLSDQRPSTAQTPWRVQADAAAEWSIRLEDEPKP
jgi:hypothetical protein